jgi:hypothetical protein
MQINTNCFSLMPAKKDGDLEKSVSLEITSEGNMQIVFANWFHGQSLKKLLPCQKVQSL